jgi:predicted nucleic acid-binding protein
LIVADTYIWIEFLKGNQPFYSDMSELLEQGQILGIEIVFAELMQGLKNKREREFISDYWNFLPKYSMDSLLFRADVMSAK